MNHHQSHFGDFQVGRITLQPTQAAANVLFGTVERASCAHVTYTCSDLALLTMLFGLDFDNNFFEESVTNSVQITMALVIQ